MKRNTFKKNEESGAIAILVGITILALIVFGILFSNFVLFPESVEPETGDLCFDGKDNDKDGFTDSDDPSCQEEFRLPSECEITCIQDSDCDDDNTLTIDLCIKPGSCNSVCTNVACKVACTSDLECDDTNSLTTDTCLQPGSCNAQCQNTLCDIQCFVDADCDDQNPTTIDICENPAACQAQCQNTEQPQCSDGEDNDNDGATDYPEDFSCNSASDNDETNPKAQCQDNLDNDGDELIDLEDTGCQSLQDNDEFSQLLNLACDDGQDNDQDGFVDYPADPGCDSEDDYSEGGLGDSQILFEWESRGIGGGGAIMVVHVDPNNGNNVYVGSDVGGLYKSEDGGQTYRLINEGQLLNVGQSNYFIYDVKVPRGNSNIVFVSNRDGIYKSTDRGEMFERISSAVKAKLVISRDGQKVFVMNAWPGERYRGLLRSFDQGNSWENLSGSLPTQIKIFKSIAIDAEDTIYVAGIGGLFKSTDNGNSWQDITPPIEPSRDANVLWVTVHQSFPTENPILYITLEPEGFQPVVFKSLDGGESWQAVNHSSTDGLGQALHRDMYTRHAAFQTIEVSPHNPDFVFAGSVGDSYSLMKTTDGGATWEEITMRPTNPNWDMGVWHEHFLKRGRVGKARSIAFHPTNDQIVYVSHEVMKTTDGGATWKSTTSREVSPGVWQSTGINGVYVEAIAMDPQNPARLYAGDNDNSMYVSSDYGRTWDFYDPLWLNPENEQNVRNPLRDRFVGPVWRGFTDFEIVSSQPNIVFGSEYAAHLGFVLEGILPEDYTLEQMLEKGVLLKSEDYGWTWNLAGLDQGLATGQIFRDGILVVENESSYDLYVGVLGSGVYKSTDEGATFVKLPEPFSNAFKYPTSLQKGQDLQTVFVSVAKNPIDTGSSPGGIFRTQNGGQSWQEITSSNSNVRNVWSIRVDPMDSQKMHAVVYDKDIGFPKGGVWRTVNGGQSWERVLAGPRMVALEINPEHPEIIYVATRNFNQQFVGGVWRSIDGGDTWDWSVPSSDLTSKHLYPLEVRLQPNDPSVVYIGTIGGGMFVAKDYYANGID